MEVFALLSLNANEQICNHFVKVAKSNWALRNFICFITASQTAQIPRSIFLHTTVDVDGHHYISIATVHSIPLTHHGVLIKIMILYTVRCYHVKVSY